MPEPADQPAQPADRRDRRVYVWWAVALTLLGLLGAFCWAVMVPYCQVRNEVRAAVRELKSKLNTYDGPSRHFAARRNAVTGLGGPEAASRKIRAYLRLPRRLAPDRYEAVMILPLCGEAGVPVLADIVTSSEEAPLRELAALCLGCKGETAAPAASALQAASRDRDPSVANAAAQALKEIKAAQERSRP
jgi:hypothetical protein